MEKKGNIFTSVMKKRQQRSNFDLSHDVKLSLDMGKLVPVYLQDCVPGDSIHINTSTMLRMAPLISPVMHKIDVFLEYFFVPNRLLWENWEVFITGSRNGKQLDAASQPAFPTLKPYLSAVDSSYGSLMDYFGVPLETDFGATEQPSGDIEISALPFAAYQLIWDEYYRDENLVMSMYDALETAVPNFLKDYNKLPDGTIIWNDVESQLSTLRPRAWEHDYFTSALPWAQKGEIVSIPVETADSLVIKYDNTATPVTQINTIDGTGFPTGANKSFYYTHGTGTSRLKVTDGTSNKDVNVDNSHQLYIEQSGTNVSGITINDLRAAIKLQEWLETNARGGSRYFESIYAHFGVKSPDARLQRPEFIGSHRSNMVISEVLQTSSPQSADDTPQGNMSGHASSVGSSRTFEYYAQEHGYIIGLLSVLPKTAYQQGIPKHFLKTQDKLEFYFPEFAHLGEQEILNMELYAGGTLAEAQGTFGYIPRYAEYKFINSRVAGDFRDTLQFWHMGRVFADTPQLNDSFISSNPTKRIFAVQDIPISEEGGTTGGSVRSFHSIYAHVYHDVRASRLMPKYGTPTL